MKTPEELKKLRDEMNALRNEVASLSPEELKALFDSEDMKRFVRVLTPEELERFTGGDEYDDQSVVYDQDAYGDPDKSPVAGLLFIPVTFAVNFNVAANANAAMNANAATTANAFAVANVNMALNYHMSVNSCTT